MEPFLIPSFGYLVQFAVHSSTDDTNNDNIGNCASTLKTTTTPTPTIAVTSSTVPVGDQFNNDLVISIIYIGVVRWFREPTTQIRYDVFYCPLFFTNIRRKTNFFTHGCWCWFCWKHFIKTCRCHRNPRTFKMFETKTTQWVHSKTTNSKENKMENGHDNPLQENSLNISDWMEMLRPLEQLWLRHAFVFYFILF